MFFVKNRKISTFVTSNYCNETMKKIEAIIERNPDGGYTAYCVDEPFFGMGDTAQAAKEEMLEGMRVLVEVSKEDDLAYPAWLDGEYEIVYKFDTQSLLEYYAGIITPAALSRMTGIHAKQIWSYTNGVKPREKQVRKIEAALHKLGQELTALSL